MSDIPSTPQQHALLNPYASSTLLRTTQKHIRQA